MEMITMKMKKRRMFSNQSGVDANDNNENEEEASRAIKVERMPMLSNQSAMDADDNNENEGKANHPNQSGADANDNTENEEKANVKQRKSSGAEWSRAESNRVEETAQGFTSPGGKSA
jgi:hypothetical protein